MRKIIAVLTVLAVFLMPCLVGGQLYYDDLVENGTFDTNMDGWDVLTSENFTVQASGGVCNFSSTNTDYIIDQNTTEFNGTGYNATVNEQSVPFGFGNGSISLQADVVTANLNPMFNESEDAWVYEEWQRNTTPYARGVYDTTYDNSPPECFGVESVKKHSINETFNMSSATHSGIGSSQFIYIPGNDTIEANWTTGEGASPNFARYTHIASPKDENHKFGAYCDFKLNQSLVYDTDMSLLFGFCHSVNTTNNGNILAIGLNYTSGMWMPELHLKGTLGNIVTTPFAFPSLTTANLTYGVRLDISYSGGFTTGSVSNVTTGYTIDVFTWITFASHSFDFNRIGVFNQDWYNPVSELSMRGWVSNVGQWLDTKNLDTAITSNLTQEFSYAKDSTITIEGYYRHYHDPQMGSITSSAVYRGVGDMVGTLMYVDTTTSSQGWTKFWGNTTGTTVQDGRLELSTTHSISEGGTTFPAKGTYWDDVYVNATSYRVNGTYESDIKNATYNADWLHIAMHNFTDPFYTDANYTVYTRSGDTPAISGSWSSWEEATFFNFTDKSGLPSATPDVTNFTIESPNDMYLQYKVEFYTQNTSRFLEILRVDISSIESVPMSADWGVMTQDIEKPYTNATELRFKYKVDHLNNTNEGNFTVHVDAYEVMEYNLSWETTDWIWVNDTLPNTFNASGTYELNFTVETQFNSTNGSASVLFDDVQMLIETQTPTITSFDITNGTAPRFTGTFVDYTRASNYSFLGLAGISTVNVTINGTTVDIPLSAVTYIGDGEFEFNYTWDSPSIEGAEMQVLDALLTVEDLEGLSDSEESSITLPTLVDYLMPILTGTFAVIIFIIVIYGTLLRHDKYGKDMPFPFLGEDKGIKRRK